MSFNATQLIGFGAGGDEAPAVITLTYIGSAASAVDGTSYDFGNFSAASAGLMIVGAVGSGSGSNATVSSVSIGGSAGTIHVNPSGSSFPTCVASRVVSAGNNNVTAVFSSTRPGASVHVWLLTNYLSATPVDFDGINTASNGTSSVITLDIPASGFAVFCGCHENANATTWSSATPRYDATNEIQRHSAADKSTVALITNHAETVSWSGSVDYGASGCSWG